MATIFPLARTGMAGKNSLPPAEFKTPALKKSFKINSLSLLNSFVEAQSKNCAKPQNVRGNRLTN
ncbi:MAG: hypothetical protein JNK50_13630 [Bacteroidia bacterium]|nr:hypothetical protein [Bacteroidia bacterium]